MPSRLILAVALDLILAAVGGVVGALAMVSVAVALVRLDLVLLGWAAPAWALSAALIGIAWSRWLTREKAVFAAMSRKA